MKKRTGFWMGSALMASVLLAGCGGGDASASGTALPAMNTTPPPLEADLASADAGVPVNLPNPIGLTDYQAVASNKNFGRRRDPFALLGPEAAFERQQQRERFFSDAGFFGSEFELPPPSADEPPPVEPQPFRRLAGVLLGDGITALIQMEDGVIYDVRPGSRIGNSPWVVVSIDTEKLVMRREGNVLPREVIVRIEEDITRNTTGTSSSGGSGNPGQAGGTTQNTSGGAGSVGAADR